MHPRPKPPCPLLLATWILGVLGAAIPLGAQSSRSVIINGVRLPDQTVQVLERRFQVPVRDGRYWYDKLSGAWGLQGGPSGGFIPPGLDLGGPLQAAASNGNTGVFINGRQLHAMDVVALQQITPVYQGRYWMDGYGNVGIENGPMLGNLWQLARSRSGGQQTVYSRDGSLLLGTDSNGCHYFNDASTSTSWASPGC